MAVWLVGAGKHGERESLALDKGIAIVGWQQLEDLSKIKSRDELRTLMEATYPDKSPKAISNYTGQVWAFINRIKVGDIVALPLKTRSAVALGKATGRYLFDKNNPSGFRHNLPVKWIRDDIPRSDFGQDLLYSLGAFMTVCRIKRNNAEDRIKAMLEGSSDPMLSAAAGFGIAENDVEGEQFDIEGYSQDQIRSCIDARFKGHELTRLVTAILKAKGYQTYSSPPGPDGGVDIIAGGGAMGFDSPRLCVQVKSGTSPVDVTSLRELQGVMKNYSAEQGLFVAWGGFKETVHKEARTLFFEIRLWDSDKLLQALLEHYNELPDEIQAELPLKRIWIMVPEEKD